MCRGRDLRVNAGKSKVMLLGGEEELECEVCVNSICLEHVSEFKYLVQMRQNVVGRWRVGGGFQVVLGLWLMLEVCNLCVLGSCMSLCLCLFLRMVVRQ